MLCLDRAELEDEDPTSEEDELEDETNRRTRENRARRGPLGDWAAIGWMAAKLNRRVMGVEFM